MASSSPDEELKRLKDLFDEATRREARFRLDVAQDFLTRQTLAEAQVKTLAERDAYIHQLHLEQLAAREALQAAHADVEIFTWMLQESEKVRNRLQGVEQSWSGRLSTPLRLLEKVLKGSATFPRDLPSDDFVYHLHTSPFRIYREDKFTFRGWAFLRDGRKISAVRVRINEGIFPGRYGLREPEIVARHHLPADRPPPGFEIEFSTTPGRHWLRLEAQVETGEWRSILNMPIWRRAI